ncbi:MAG: primosomal protein N' [Clostridia bacterium]|nr:primosomal protein N' [Clostridia bacterium]
MRFCQVIVDIAHEDVDRVFTYRIPEGMTVLPGMRVHVPFGHRKRIEGIVIRFEEHCDVPEDRIREIQEPLEDYPVILPQLLDLADYIHRTSFCAMAQALRLLYPAEMRGERITQKKREFAVLTVPEDIRTQVREAQHRAPKRAAILEALEQSEGNEAETALLRSRLGECRQALTALAAMGLIRLEQREILRRPYGEMEALSAADPELTLEQRAVLSQLLPAIDRGEGRFLLYGVTGSGKTEVYIRAVRAVAAQGKTAIVLVPEIALTPQMVSWFRSRFGEDAAVLHSRLSPGERYDEWRRIRRGEVRVVIGARSAIFAPLDRVGLIIVDEEHEQTYQAENTPQYDARDLARRRCEREGATLLLASATPSLRSFALAQRGDLTLLEMPTRVAGRPLPEVRIIDMREELRQGNRSVFSGAMLDGLTRCMEAGKQAILFVNRRGYSTFVSCRSCGYTVQCPHCDISMTYHSSGNVLRCHYCGMEQPVPAECPECGSRYIRYFGTGTQRVEEEVRRRFPGVLALRMDNDTTRGKDAHATILERFRSGEAKILVGTQMIAKGLDFPNVTMVGIVAADAMLKLPDYRSAERAFQLLTQVAGRAGRADTSGEVFLQTYDPEHYAVETASRQDYRAFYEREMHYRRQALYPPFTVIARLVFEADEDERGRREASAAAGEMEAFFEKRLYLKKYLKTMRVLECPVHRIRDKYRWELVVKMVDQPVCREALERLSALAEGDRTGCRSVCQINPQSLL